MTTRSCIVLGSTGLVGSAVRTTLEAIGVEVIGVHSGNYAEHIGKSADALVNCNGNTYRFKANADPAWDFSASVSSVMKSLFDFRVGLYLYVSTIDVYNHRGSHDLTRETTAIVPADLEPYAFHKWLAERLVERHAPRAVILRCATIVGRGLKKGPLFDLLSGRPVHMAIASRLSLVDTDTIAMAVQAAFEGRLPRHIVNVAGTGPVTLAELGRMAGADLRASSADAGRLYDYDINNECLCSVMPMASSAAIAHKFIADWRANTK